MNCTRTPLTQIAQVHRNLESVATVATVATGLLRWLLSRCHPIKKVATSGNTHIAFNIKELVGYCFWLSLLPQKSGWQQIGNGWRRRFTGVLPQLPLLPRFLKSEEHLYASKSGEVTV